PHHGDVLHPREGRPLLQLARQLLDEAAVALDPHAHAAVLEIHDVAGEAELGSLALDVVAVADALDAAVHQDLSGRTELAAHAHGSPVAAALGGGRRGGPRNGDIGG